MLNFQDFMNHLGFINDHSALPAILFFLCFRSSFGTVARIAFAIVLISFLADFINDYLIWMVMLHKFNPGFNSYLINNIWIVTDYFLVSWLFTMLIPEKKKLIYTLTIIFSAGAIISYVWFYSFFRSNAFVGFWWSASISLLSIVTFLEILKTAPIRRVLGFPVFWIITGLFLFSTTTLLSHLFRDYLVFELGVSSQDYVYVRFFTIFFNLVKNLMIFVAFVLIKRGDGEYIHEIEKS